MVSRRERSTNTLGSRLESINTKISKIQSQVGTPKANDVLPGAIAEDAVTERELAPGSVTAKGIARGAVGSEHLGIVNEINSDGSVTINIPEGNLYLSGTEYVVPLLGVKSLLVDEDGKVYLGDSGSGGYQLGSISPWATDTIPSWALELNGQAVSRTTYSGLFALYGTQFGVGDGSTTFNVPDWREHTVAGFSSGDPTFGTLGAHIGSETHTHDLGDDSYAQIGIGQPGGISRVYMKLAAIAGNIADRYGAITNFSTGTTGTMTAATALGGNTDAESSLPPTVIAKWIVCVATSSGDFDTEVQTALVGRVSPSYLPRETVRFTASGAFTKASYPWLTAIRVRVVGAGGAGGGLASASTLVGRSGGGAGGYCEKFITNIAGLTSSETITIGAGATGSAANGASGGSSVAFSMTAGGGGGGASGPGEPGTASGGDLNIPGQAGNNGGAGGAAIAFGGNGGSTPLGSGGAGAANTATNLPGIVGDGYGAGGGGGARGGGTSAPVGGSGAPGIVVVELFG